VRGSAAQHFALAERFFRSGAQRNRIYTQACRIRRLEQPHADGGARGRRFLILAAHAVEHREETLVALVDVITHNVAQVTTFAPQKRQILLVDCDALRADRAFHAVYPSVAARLLGTLAFHFLKAGAQRAFGIGARSVSPRSVSHLAAEKQEGAGGDAGRPAGFGARRSFFHGSFRRK